MAAIKDISGDTVIDWHIPELIKHILQDKVDWINKHCYYSLDSPQAGLEVQCVLLFTSKSYNETNEPNQIF